MEKQSYEPLMNVAQLSKLTNIKIATLRKYILRG
jgi:hypothetical protein